MRKITYILSIIAIFMVFACSQTDEPAQLNPVDTNTGKINPPSADTLLENMVYELGNKMLATDTIKNSNTTKVDVNALLDSAKTEAERRGYKVSSDPSKIMPAVISGITSGLIKSDASFDDKVKLSKEIGALYQKVLEEPSLKLPAQSPTTWNQKEMTSQVAPAIVGPLANHRAEGMMGAVSTRSSNGSRSLELDEIDAILAATLTGYISALPVTDTASTQELIDITIQSGMDKLARSEVSDSTLYKTILTSTTEGLDILAVNETSLKNDLKTMVVDSVKSSGQIMEALKIDGVLNDTTLISSIKTDISSNINTITSDWGTNKVVTADANSSLAEGIADPVTIPDMVIKYERLETDTEDEFLVLKFSTITKVEKEEFWRGGNVTLDTVTGIATGTGTLVGEVLYAYDDLGNIISKTWKYGGTVWKVDDGFKFDGLKMIEDTNKEYIIYDDLGRVIDYNGYAKYEYKPDGSSRRNYYGDNKIQLGYMDYTIDYKMGTTPVGSGYYWYGNHSTIKWMSWYDDDRYDIVSGLYRLTSKDKIKTITSKVTGLDKDGKVVYTGDEAMDFNDIGKLVSFRGGLKNDGTSSTENYYDPLQRIKLYRRRAWDTGKVVLETFYTYDNTGNVTAVTKHYDTAGQVLYEAYFKPDMDVINNGVYSDPRDTMRAIRTGVKNNTTDPLTVYPAAYIIGSMSENFAKLEIVDDTTLTYKFTYKNSMVAWEGGNGTINFKLAQKDNWDYGQFGVGKNPLESGKGSVVLSSESQGNISVNGLIDGKDYTITVTTNGILVAIKIESSDGSDVVDTSLLSTAYIIGDLTAKDTFVPLTKISDGIFTYTFTYANSMASWGNGAGLMNLKITELNSWAGVMFGAGFTQPVIGSGSVDIVKDSQSNIIVNGLSDGVSYMVTVTDDGTKVSFKIEQAGGTDPVVDPVTDPIVVSGIYGELVTGAQPLTKVSDGVYTFQFTYSSATMNSWGSPEGNVVFKVLENMDWTGSQYGGGTPVTPGSGNVVLSELVDPVFENDPPVVLTGLTEGVEYIITITTTNDTISCTIDTVK
ncbi:MAG: hypothetical protein A2015_12780 [Spirochaetes bacterium GWF1_31_7]|nr:MAG: hypothetical protein A2Y30_10570 [Spirochaetes bacterium GWE1_32_154]OHD49257.1 MAG: hypothetical protein A2Y29_16200 [Spirochaetes bacterium GWE2_31_10]OHD51819.1 MAG: hypothetical protein A2015_12780 [Spirochaetes bacterium GWF1_31_7]OHD79997.1 MAG: hypothetical protein A2355_13275 [Spirochaetes bacterium RIFOXYB1_FULL_32_8]HBD95323.1 hypothetical protein [Spirochaetia bacterium]